MSDIKEEIKQLENEIIEAHKKHYESSPTGLIIPTESPNGNTIYHLHSNGEVTFQKGGWAYLQRSEFTLLTSIRGWNKLELQFIHKSDENSSITYCILTEEECRKFGDKMIELVKKLN